MIPFSGQGFHHLSLLLSVNFSTHYNELRNLQKAAKRGGATQKAKEKAFVKSLEKTFDISHAESKV